MRQWQPADSHSGPLSAIPKGFWSFNAHAALNTAGTLVVEHTPQGCVCYTAKRARQPFKRSLLNLSCPECAACPPVPKRMQVPVAKQSWSMRCPVLPGSLISASTCMAHRVARGKSQPGNEIRVLHCRINCLTGRLLPRTSIRLLSTTASWRPAETTFFKSNWRSQSTSKSILTRFWAPSHAHSAGQASPIYAHMSPSALSWTLLYRGQAEHVQRQRQSQGHATYETRRPVNQARDLPSCQLYTNAECRQVQMWNAATWAASTLGPAMMSACSFLSRLCVRI